MANRDDENTIILQHSDIIGFAGEQGRSPTLLEEFVGGHRPFLHIIDTLFTGGMWVLPYSQDTIDTNLADQEGATELVLLRMRNRRNVYARQNPDMDDIFLGLPWHLHVYDAPPSTEDLSLIHI
eukprot:4433715-Karenia_brevis.AAC.1